MKDPTPQKIYLSDYKAPHFQVTGVHLFFDLHEGKTTVTQKSRYQRASASKDLFLDGHDVKLVSVKLNDKLLQSSDYKLDQVSLTLFNVPDSFDLEIITEIEPEKNLALDGLYKSKGIYCTQCEAQGFRKITYFQDRPDVMTKYDVTIEADEKQYPLLLSNGNLVKTEKLGNGRHRAIWHDPFNKPCYLFALVAGDLGSIQDTFTTKSGKKVELFIYAAHGLQKRTEFAMECVKRAMKWDEDTYGLEYDLERYMIVAIDDFNAGAMENKGLNIFNSKLVLASTDSATDYEFESIDSVIAHEYFHNWSGDRVTLRDWFHLSLKEGLTVFRDQEYTSDTMSRAVKRIDDVVGLRSVQFTEDAGPNAHPVRPSYCFSVDNFFTPTIYEKGAEVIRMMQMIVGRPGFIKGLQKYFAMYDGQAVTTDEFVKAIELANGVDLTQFKLWYEQAGTPVITVKTEYQNNQFILTLSQKCPDTPEQTNKKPMHIPIKMGLLTSGGQEILEETLHLKQTEQVFKFDNIKEKPVLSVLREFSAPVRLNYERSDSELLFLIGSDTDSFSQWESAQKIYQKLFKQLISQHANGQPLKADTSFVSALEKALLNPNSENAFKALLLDLPSDAILAQEESILRPESFFAARTYLEQLLGKGMQQTLLKIYKEFNGFEAHSREPLAFGHRRLKNKCLELLSYTNFDLVIEQYKAAPNMTDRVAALSILANSASKFKDTAFDDFYNAWKDDDLVLNKWFQIQASSTAENTYASVKKLSEHPKFNLYNPNKTYSLLRSFGKNILAFYSSSNGEAFEFMADKTIELDKKNGHVASSLANTFQLWKKLPAERAQYAEKALKRIAATPGLSRNTYEIVSRLLS